MPRIIYCSTLHTSIVYASNEKLLTPSPAAFFDYQRRFPDHHLAPKNERIDVLDPLTKNHLLRKSINYDGDIHVGECTFKVNDFTLARKNNTLEAPPH
jgi:hypothetical protein